MSRKPPATQATVMEFVRLIWPDDAEAALSMFTEEALLRDAINLIRKLQTATSHERIEAALLETMTGTTKTDRPDLWQSAARTLRAKMLGYNPLSNFEDDENDRMPWQQD